MKNLKQGPSQKEIADMHKESLNNLLNDFCSEASPHNYIDPVLFLLGEWIGNENLNTDDFDSDFRKDLMCDVKRTMMYLLKIHYQWSVYQKVLKLAMEELVFEHENKIAQ